MRILLAVALFLALVSPAASQAPCQGNEPYWFQNADKVGQPPFGGLWLLPGSLAITAMSLNARGSGVTPHGDIVETHPGCLPLFVVSQQPRPKASDY